MWELGSCPKCNGDVYVDYRAREKTCLQCGMIVEIPKDDKQLPLLMGMNGWDKKVYSGSLK